MTDKRNRASKPRGDHVKSWNARHSKTSRTQMRLKATNLAVGILGLLAVAFGWSVDNQSAWANRIAAPKYISALGCYQSLLEDNTLVQSDDRGFAELRPILEEELEGDGDLEIASFRSVGSGYSNLAGGFSELTITLEITLRDGRRTEGRITSLESRIRNRYLETPLTRASGLFLWLGVVLSFTSIIVSFKIR